MAEAQGLDNQISKEPAEKSLKPFSDADIIGELSRRFHADPKLDPTVLEKFDEVTVEIKKKLTPEEPKADLKPPEVQVPSESEGKKWAKIIREKGAGGLFGKFKNSWGYYDESGNFHGIEPQGQDSRETAIGETNAGLFGKDEIPRTGRSIEAIRRRLKKNTSSNILVIGDAGLDENQLSRFNGWKTFKYLAWYSLLQVGGGAGTSDRDLDFYFTLPREESSQFIEDVNRNPDLIESVFQSIYPRFIGENGPKRFIANKLTIVDNIVTSEKELDVEPSLKAVYQDRGQKLPHETVVISSRERLLDFSKPVGEIPL